jgi:hypothetical protein
MERLGDPTFIGISRIIIGNILYIYSTMNQDDPVARHIDERFVNFAYTIACKKNHVFETSGILEDRLHEKAAKFIVEFELVVNILRAGFVIDMLTIANALSSFDAFQADFIPWRNRATHVSVSKMVLSLKQLYIAEASLASERDPDDAYMVNTQARIQPSIDNIRSKLVRCDCQAELDRIDAWRNDTLSHPEKVKAIIGFGKDNMDFSVDSLDRFIEQKLFHSTIYNLSSFHIVHEVLLDSSFRVDVNTASVINEVKVNQYYAEAFWEDILRELKLPNPIYTEVSSVLNNTLNELRRIAGPSSPLADEVATTINVNDIPWGGFNLMTELFDRIFSLILRIQVKEREDAFKSNWETIRSTMTDAPSDKIPEIICSALRFFADHVKVMQIDSLNDCIVCILDVIKNHGADYERTVFEAHLRQENLSLSRTNEWLCKEVHNISVGCFKKIVSRDSDAFFDVYQSALVGLIADPSISGYKAADVPEVFYLDLHRINAFSREFRTFVNCSTAMRIIGYYATQEMIQNEVANRDSEVAKIRSNTDPGLDIHGILTSVSNIVLSLNPSKLEDIGPFLDAIGSSALNGITSTESMEKMRAEMEMAFSNQHHVIRITV